MLAHMAEAEFGDDELEALRIPVSFIAAEHDPFCPPDVMRYAQKRFADATMHVIGGASHSVYYENPQAWNDLVSAIADGELR